MVLTLLLQQVTGMAATPPDVAIWVALIMSVGGIVGAYLNNRRSTRHSAEIESLKRQLSGMRAQLLRERLTWHSWARQVVIYLRSLPGGHEIADGLPPMPDTLSDSGTIRNIKRGRKGR